MEEGTKGRWGRGFLSFADSPLTAWTDYRIDASNAVSVRVPQSRLRGATSVLFRSSPRAPAEQRPEGKRDTAYDHRLPVRVLEACDLLRNLRSLIGTCGNVREKDSENNNGSQTTGHPRCFTACLTASVATLEAEAALIDRLPTCEADALDLESIRTADPVIAKSAAKAAMATLYKTGKVRRVGPGKRSDAYRYFSAAQTANRDR